MKYRAMPAQWFGLADAGGKIKRVLAYPEEGLEGKDSVERRESSVAKTDDGARSYSASSLIRARIVGTSERPDEKTISHRKVKGQLGVRSSAYHPRSHSVR